MKVIHIAILNIFLLGYFALIGLALSGAILLQEHAQQNISNGRLARQAAEMVSGTIEGIDRSGMKVILQTNLGLEALPVANSAVLQRLSLGEQVTMKLDGDGKIKTATAQPVPGER